MCNNKFSIMILWLFFLQIIKDDRLLITNIDIVYISSEPMYMEILFLVIIVINNLRTTRLHFNYDIPTSIFPEKMR